MDTPHGSVKPTGPDPVPDPGCGVRSTATGRVPGVRRQRGPSGTTDYGFELGRIWATTESLKVRENTLSRLKNSPLRANEMRPPVLTCPVRRVPIAWVFAG